eukprot:680182-Rhodomonas_salina.1
MVHHFSPCTNRHGLTALRLSTRPDTGPCDAVKYIPHIYLFARTDMVHPRHERPLLRVHALPVRANHLRHHRQPHFNCKHAHAKGRQTERQGASEREKGRTGGRERERESARERETPCSDNCTRQLSTDTRFDPRGLEPGPGRARSDAR